jgi:hypothetical protein
MERERNMATDNLLGSAVRIRRGWHGGRTGKVVVFEQSSGLPSYSVIKVQLDGGKQVVNINIVEELEKLPDLSSDPYSRGT